MNIFPNPVERATADVVKLRADRERVDARVVALEQELAECQSVTGDQKLDLFLAGDETHSDAAMRVVTIKATLVDLEQAKAALIRRIQAAMIALAKAKADELRVKARKLQGKYDRLSADRLKLLEQLRDLEGGNAGWVDEYFLRRGYMPIGVGGGLGPVVAPAFAKLEGEISQFHADATAIERRAELNAAGGRISAENLDAILAICADPEQLAPLPREIRAWFDVAAAAAASAWRVSPLGAPIAGDPPPLGPMTNFTLVWKDGVIDSAESNWRNLQTRRPTHFDHAYQPRNAYATPSEATAARGY